MLYQNTIIIIIIMSFKVTLNQWESLRRPVKEKKWN